MKFAQPFWLLAGLAICSFLLWRYRRFNRRQRAALAAFISPRLFEKLTASVSAPRRKLKQALFIGGLACLFVALARPQAGFRWEEAHRQGIELLVAVDTSKSMLTEDVKPNRLGRAKLAVNDLVNKLDGDGVGLLAFAGDAFLQCPITLDYDAFRESVESLDSSAVSRGGTDIGGAIREARAVLDGRAGKEKVLVLITDGEDLGGEAVAAARDAAKDGLKIYTVGVGTAAGELVPVPAENGGKDFVKDPSGQFVKSRLDEGTLQQIAVATGGIYKPLGQQGEGLTAIYEQGLAKFTRHDLDSRRTKVYLEQFQWALLAALACFAGEMLIGTRKRGVRKASSGAASGAARAAGRPATGSPVMPVIIVACAFFALPGLGRASVTGAEKDYLKGNFSQAEKEYAATLATQPAKPELQFNLGSAAYKTGDYSRATAAFQNSLKTTETPLQENAYYNLGNTEYRAGQKSEKTSPEETIKTWEQALQSYEAALQIKGDDADAKYNRDLVRKKLEQLKKKQEQQQKQAQQKPRNSDQPQKQGQKKQDDKQPGQGGKDQKQPDQKKPRPGQPDQPQAGSGPPGSQKKPSQPGQPQPSNPGRDKQTAKQEQNQNGQPQPSKPDGKPEPHKGGEPNGQREQASERARGEPGQMTKEEAKQLLDSLKGDEHKLSAAQYSRALVKPQDEQNLKDW